MMRTFKGQVVVPRSQCTHGIYCDSWGLQTINTNYIGLIIGISHRGTLVAVHPTMPDTWPLIKCEYIPGPSSLGAKWFRYRVSINHPLGFNWHPLEGAGTHI